MGTSQIRAFISQVAVKLIALLLSAQTLRESKKILKLAGSKRSQAESAQEEQLPAGSSLCSHKSSSARILLFPKNHGSDAIQR
jgi:hypothetical protein